MDVEQRDEEISRFFTFLFCLLASKWNLEPASGDDENDLELLKVWALGIARIMRACGVSLFSQPRFCHLGRRHLIFWVLRIRVLGGKSW
jgi:hypothetical protein